MSPHPPSEIPPSPPLKKGGEELTEALAWLDYCLGETILALEVVKGVTRADLGSMSVDQYLSMCEAAAGLITLRGRTARSFRPSCPVGEMQAAVEALPGQEVLDED